MITKERLLDILNRKFSTDQKGEIFDVTHSMTLGVVVDTDDPLQMGRLRVFCPSHGDNPEKIHQLSWAVYVSPFGGTINNDKFSRQGKTSHGSVSYGLWAIPELGANVLVGCIDGDLRRRFWSGVVFDQQQTHTLANGRFVLSDNGNADGPLSSEGTPIEPAYSNAKKAFNGKNDSPEWQTRIADYSVTAVDKDVHIPPLPDKIKYLDQQHDELSRNQKLKFNKDIVGTNGYNWSGFGSIPFKSSQTFSLSTPGFAGIIFDDRPFNNRSKLRSASGHTILLDDTNERIYIATNTGNAWMEMDSSGNIDVYSSRRVSINSDMDINLNSKRSVRINGEEGVFIHAGGRGDSENLTEAPVVGQIRIQAEDDMHLVSKNFRQLSYQNSIFEIGNNKCETVGGSSLTQVEHDINLVTNEGDYNIMISGAYNLNVVNLMNMFAIDGARFNSKGDVEFYSYFGKLDIGAQQDITIKSVSGNVNIEAAGGNSGRTGAVKIKSPNSQGSFSDTGITITTSEVANVQTGGDVNFRANSPTQQDQPFPDQSEVPAIGCSLSGNVPIAGFSGADLAARCAWNAGFRGQSLTIAVAIAGAESSFNHNAIGDVALETDKWGPSCGFWQIRSLVTPSDYSYPDTLRVKDNLFDPQYNANTAYVLSKNGKNFGAWSTYTGNNYLAASNMNPAVQAITNMCSMGGITVGNDGDVLQVGNITSANSPILFSIGVDTTALALRAQGIVIQSLQDITMRSISQIMAVPMISGVVDTLNETSMQLNVLAWQTSTAMEIIKTLSGAGGIDFAVDVSAIISAIPGLPSLYTAVQQLVTNGEQILLDTVKGLAIPYFRREAQNIFNFENFNLNGITII